MNKFLKVGFAVFAAIALVTAFGGCEQGTSVDLTPDKGGTDSLLDDILAQGPMREFDINRLPEPAEWNEWGEILNLPDPFQKADGSKINNNTQWMPNLSDPHTIDSTRGETVLSRREEIRKIVQHYEYGYLPPPPDHISFSLPVNWNWDTSTGGANTITIYMWMGNAATYDEATQKVSMTITYTLPSIANGQASVYGDGPYPAYTSNQSAWGWGQINMPIGEGSYDTARIGVLFPDRTANWATNLDAPSSLMCSAWGFSRVLDALEWAAEQAIAAGKTRYLKPEWTMVTGTSRGGKQALVVAAFAESQRGTKVGVCFPNASGSLGASMERFLSPVFNNKMDYFLKVWDDGTGNPLATYAVVPGQPYDKMYTLGKDAKGIGLDQGFQTQHHAWTDSGGFWPSYRNKQFAPLETRRNIDKEGGKGYLGTIPYDQHFVMSLVAPRGLLITGGSLDYWNNPESVQLGYYAVREVYKFLDADKNLGFRWFDQNHSGATLKAAEVHEFGDAIIADTDPDAQRDISKFPTSKYRQVDIYPIADPRSTMDYARMYWKAPGSSEKTIREQALEAADL